MFGPMLGYISKISPPEFTHHDIPDGIIPRHLHVIHGCYSMIQGRREWKFHRFRGRHSTSSSRFMWWNNPSGLVSVCTATKQSSSQRASSRIGGLYMEIPVPARATFAVVADARRSYPIPARRWYTAWVVCPISFYARKSTYTRDATECP